MTLVGTIQIPSAMEITAITRGYPTVVTVSPDADIQVNTYIPGQRVVLTIPYSYGIWQLDGVIARITEVSGNDLSLDINSFGFDPFSVPSSGIMPPSIAPYGSQNLPFLNTTTQIAFQSLNNEGN